MRSLRALPLVALGVLAGAALSRPLEAPASAQSRELTVEGSCERDDLVVYESSGRLRCVSIDDLRFPRCDDDEVLGVDVWGELRCVRPLPECSSREILVSEGSGRWRCQSPPAR